MKMCAPRPARHALRATIAWVLAFVLATGTAACGGGASTRPEGGPRDAGATTTGPGATVATRRPAVPRRAGPPASVRAVAWTHAALLRRLEGRRIRVDRRFVAIDPGTVTCGGVGPPSERRNGQPAWTRFRCVQPTFPPGRLTGPDLLFVVEPTGRRTFAVSGQRFAAY
jgi:hypothetical protein